MKKVLALLPENNKGKFITKGFTLAFRKLSYFVFEKKFYDLNINEINKIAPDILFVYWSGIYETNFIVNIIDNITSKTNFIHCAKKIDDIPDKYTKMSNHYFFSPEQKSKNKKYIQPINVSDYSTDFQFYRYNITFAGNPSYQIREELLALLIKNFGRINIFSRSDDFYKSLDDMIAKQLLDSGEVELYKNSYKGYVDTTEELAKIYNSSRINLDMFSQNTIEVNYRILEITASEGFLIAPYSKELVKQYSNGQDIETYKSASELIDKIKFYLKNSNIAMRIAQRGKLSIPDNNSYYNRLKEMLKVIYGKDISGR